MFPETQKTNKSLKFDFLVKKLLVAGSLITFSENGGGEPLAVYDNEA